LLSIGKLPQNFSGVLVGESYPREGKQNKHFHFNILFCRGGIKDSSYDQYDQTKTVYCPTNPCLYSSLPRNSSNVIGRIHCPHALHVYLSVSDSCDVISHAHQTPPQDLVCLANRS